MAFVWEFKPSGRNGILHQYTSRLTAFEHTPNPTATPPQNLLLFVGGLFDGLLTVPYTTSISNALPPTWSLAQAHLSSSHLGFGTSSLQADVAELSTLISYFRTFKTGRIVLMGHSTGSQDTIEYLVGPGHASRAPIDGGILQAPGSDRETLVHLLPPDVYDSSVKVAQSCVDDGRADDVIPRSAQPLLPAPISARRWLSLASPGHDGDDDYFSSDLSDAQLEATFGQVGKIGRGAKLAIIFSGADEYMPPSVDKEKVLERWIGFVEGGGGRVDRLTSGVVKDARHNLQGDPESVVNDLVERVLGFLERL